MLLALILITMLPTILIIINSLLFKKEMTKRNKPSPFECGFDPKSSARLPFSIKFFLIAIIFLIFDIEITLILPLPIIFKMNSPMIWLTLMVMFISILLAGLFHEWNLGALNWSY